MERVFLLMTWLGAVAAFSPTDTNPINLVVNQATGGFKLEVPSSKLSFNSADIFFQVSGKLYSTADGSLKKTNVSDGLGADTLGRYQYKSILWQAGGARVETYYRYYKDTPVVLFGQRTSAECRRVPPEAKFPDGANGTSVGNPDYTCTGFPTLALEGQAGLLGYLSFGGNMFGGANIRAGEWYYQTTGIRSGITGGPLAVFDQDLNTVVLSPFSEFMAASVWHNGTGEAVYGGEVNYGIMGQVNNIPRTSTTRPSCSTARALHEWGGTLMRQYGKTRARTESDFSSNYLGYWTDNVPGLFWGTFGRDPYVVPRRDLTVRTPRGTPPVAGSPPGHICYVTDQMNRIKPMAARLLSPTGAGRGYIPDGHRRNWDRSFSRTGAGKTPKPACGAYYYYHTEPGKNYEDTMVDAMAYAKEVGIPYRYVQLDSWWYYKGAGGGVKTWDARPDVFPSGLRAKDTTYAKQNGGNYSFIVEKQLSIPTDMMFWDDLFTQSREWGLIVYEQDWLDVEFKGLQATLSSISLGKQWLMQFGQAASSHDLNIQYCMANPRHALQSVQIPAVTQFGQAASSHDLNIQYCMANPRHALQSVQIPSVTQWLMQFGQAASSHELNIQYCMANPRHALQSLQIPAVTQFGQAASSNELNIQYCMANPRHALQSLQIPAVTQAASSHDLNIQYCMANPRHALQSVQIPAVTQAASSHDLNIQYCMANPQHALQSLQIPAVTQAASSHDLNIQYCMANPRHALQSVPIPAVTQAASSHELNIQYCMANPRHALQSVQIPSVTQARVSSDYHPGNEQWRIGIGSIMAHALGVRPFKDTFWSTSNQTGSPYGHATEPYPRLQSAVASLSAGPVGPSDMVKGADVKLIMRSIRHLPQSFWLEFCFLPLYVPKFTGDLYRPQKALQLDLGPKGEVWTTYSDISGLRFGIILAADLQEDWNINAVTAGFGEMMPGMAFTWPLTPSMMPFGTADENLQLKQCGKDDFAVWYTSPFLILGNQTAMIIGETDKWVPMSPQRVKNILMYGNNVVLSLTGAPGETVTMAFTVGVKGLVEISCVLSEAGTATLNLNKETCY
ncbi:hypothetical protein Bbelb_167560 [Branchiostoma belcheri]|nr:hypothetical protein Bbelb_167560 [Branchiostoma belcheri]